MVEEVLFEPVSAVKSLTSFLTSFLKCHKDIANLPTWFGHAWPNPSKIMLQTCKRVSSLSACKTLTSKLTSFFKYYIDTAYLVFWVLYACLVTPIKNDSINLQITVMGICTKNQLHPSLLSWDIPKFLQFCYFG